MAIRRTESERAAQLVKIPPQLEEVLSKSAKIAIKTKRRILFVDPADVVIIEAPGKYCYGALQDRTYSENRFLRWRKS